MAKKPSRPPRIIGVGASAGGLEAFTQLLQQLPDTSQPIFVLVQHLSPQHESALPALLAARTHLKVIQVTDGLAVRPGHVYVIPPNVQITIENRHLNLQPRPFTRSQYTPIDRFFQSLARSEQDRAIAIVLSGTASDGAAGIQEIKTAGGITIVQRPDSAKYDGMPRAALATGMVDLSLTTTEIADYLAHVEQHPYLTPAQQQRALDPSMPSEVELNEIFALLHRGRIFTELDAAASTDELLQRVLQEDTRGDGASRPFAITFVDSAKVQRHIIATARRVELEKGRDSLVLLLRDASHETAGTP